MYSVYFSKPGVTISCKNLEGIFLLAAPPNGTGRERCICSEHGTADGSLAKDDHDTYHTSLCASDSILSARIQIVAGKIMEVFLDFLYIR
jgi:hypothetical protein